MTWVPEPIDTRDVELPAALAPLTEQLARNIHEVWARQRLADGWTYGPERDDAARLHPGLVPYASLTESERQYDRMTALETLRTIVSLGFRIVPPPADETSVSWTRPRGDVGRGLPRESASAAFSWPPHGGAAPGAGDGSRAALPSTVADHQRARDLLARGMPLRALDVLEPLDRDGDAVLSQLWALALLRCGAVAEAQDVLLALHRGGNDDEETLGLLARTWKERAERAPRGERERLLRLAGELYARAFERTKGLWTGINAATAACRVGRLEAARTLAWAVRERALIDRGGDAYWAEATLGEAALLLDEPEEAHRRYARAASLARQSGRYGDLASTARQAALLGDAGKDVDAVLEVLQPPRVAVWCGEAETTDGAETTDVTRSRPPDPSTLRDQDVAFVCATVLDEPSARFVEQARAEGLLVHVVCFDADQDGDVVTRLSPGGDGPLDRRYAQLVAHGLAAQWARRLHPTRDRGKSLLRTVPSPSPTDDPRPPEPTGLLGLLRARAASADAVPALRELLAAGPAATVRIDIGDGMLLVYDDPRVAARLALELVGRAQGLRVMLHAAPRAVGSETPWDVHLVACARLPDTPPDHVYATEAAAALVEALGADDIASDAIGRTADGDAIAHLSRVER